MNSLKLCKIVAFLGLTASTGMLIVPARAELLELTNGDHYQGKVISMTQTTVEFQSEIQGRVKLPREKVARITFHEPAATPAAGPVPQAMTVPQVRGAPPVAPGATTAAAQPGTVEEVVKQMREQGVDAKIVKQVQEQIFGKASPEAANKFNETMEGLMSGKISVQDIRAQAVNSIKLIKEARKELGDDAGDMLDGYQAILEKFVQETDTGTPSTASAPSASRTTAPPSR